MYFMIYVFVQVCVQVVSKSNITFQPLLYLQITILHLTCKRPVIFRGVRKVNPTKKKIDLIQGILEEENHHLREFKNRRLQK